MNDDVILVEWIDSYHNPGWEPLRDKLQDDHSAADCRSVGWIIENSEDFLAITNGWSGEHAVDGALFIPKRAIKNIFVLSKSSLGEGIV